MSSAFNQTASDFLQDIGRVFPDNQTVAKASALLNCAVAMDEDSLIPALVFMDGQPAAEWKTLNRRMFQIPANRMDELLKQMNKENKAIMQRYVDNMATILQRTLAHKDDLNRTVAELKQGQTMEKLQALTKDPQKAMALLQNPGALESLGEGILSNPEAMQLVEQFKPMAMMAMSNLVPHLQQGALDNLPVPRQGS